MTARPLRPVNGFSLVELMVVLFVMGLLATAAVLTMPGSERDLRVEAERFAARTLAARDEAITGAAPVALVVSDAGYYFQRREQGQWQAMSGSGLGLTPWNKGTIATQEGGERSRIVFDPVGLASADASVRLAHGSAALSVRIARDGKVRVDAAP